MDGPGTDNDNAAPDRWGRCFFGGVWSHELAVAHFAELLRGLAERERYRLALGQRYPLAERLAEEFGGEFFDQLDRADSIIAAALHQANRPTAPGNRFGLVSAAEVLELPPVECLVEGVLTTGGLSVLAGASNSGKSLLALDLAVSVGLDQPWRGDLPVRAGLVVFVAAEAMGGQGARLRAALSYRQHRGAPAALHYLPAAPQIRKPVDVAALLASIAQLPGAPRLVILDTMRATLGGSDSDDEAVAEYMSGAARLARETGAHVMTLHHTGWQVERERGSTVLRAAADTVLLVSRDDQTVRLSHLKQRDLPPTKDLLWQIEPWGESVVLRAVGEDDLRARPLVIPESRQRALDALQQADDGAGASFTAWLTASGMTPATFKRAVADLKAWGLIQHNGKKWAAS